jgi:hypothetical protein
MPKMLGSAPAPWWEVTEDRDLMVGICKHGYLQYSKLWADDELCFKARFRVTNSLFLSDNNADDDADSATDANIQIDDLESLDQIGGDTDLNVEDSVRFYDSVGAGGSENISEQIDNTENSSIYIDKASLSLKIDMKHSDLNDMATNISKMVDISIIHPTPLDADTGNRILMTSNISDNNSDNNSDNMNDINTIHPTPLDTDTRNQSLTTSNISDDNSDNMNLENNRSVESVNAMNVEDNSLLGFAIPSATELGVRVRRIVSAVGRYRIILTKKISEIEGGRDLKPKEEKPTLRASREHFTKKQKLGMPFTDI